MHEGQIDYSCSIPGLDELFVISLEDDVIYFELDLENAKQPYPGEYTATFTIFTAGKPDLSNSASVSFWIDCAAKFATAKPLTRPEPKIQIVSTSG